MQSTCSPCSDFTPDADRVESFRTRLVKWYQESGRQFAWRSPRADPYRILVAEIMLRKTTARNVQQVFETFTARYPLPEALATADESELRDVIRPLGIADRARLLRMTARRIVERHGAQVPASFDALLALPGVGRYTANAVRCFGYGQPAALVDTNVIRVLRRVFSLASSKARPHTDPVLWCAAESLVMRDNPQSYNRALLDLGAGICTFRHPRCLSCPVSGVCDYFRTQSPLERSQARRPARANRAAV